MDAEIVRIILLVFGAIVVLGIYLWDKIKKKQGENQAVVIHDEDEKMVIHDDIFDEPLYKEEKSAPIFDDELEQALSSQSLTEELDGLNELMEEEPAVEKGEQIPLQLDTEETLSEDFLLLSEMENVPTEIIQIHVVSKKQPFTHQQIQDVAHVVELEYGEMAIYHRYIETSTGRHTLFSMANLAEPGYFDPKASDEEKIPGLLLFAQLPTVKDGLAVFSDMLFTAERIAGALNADLQDGSHSAMTKQTIAHTREQILAHRRKLQLLAAGME